MAKMKLNFRFHDPNPPGVAAEYIAKVFVEVNRKKLDRLIREEMSKQKKEERESMEETGRYSA